MSDELARCADEAAIMRVVQEYSRAADRCDQAALAAAYHPDGIDEHGSHFHGLGSEFAAWTAAQRELFTTGVHHVTTMRVEIQGDVAAAESVMFGLVRLSNGQISWSSGRYLDRFERRDGRWRIAYRRFVRDIGLPVPAHPVEPAEEETSSARSAADPSYALFDAVRDERTEAG